MGSSSPHDFQADFFGRYPLAESIIRLFDSLPQTYFYAKDAQSRFVKVNRLFLENHGLDDEKEALGKTDHDFHPPLMAEAYISEDRRVMATKKPLAGQVWMVLHRRSVPRWYVSTKTPVLDSTGTVIGIAGAMYQIDERKELSQFLQELLPVARYMEKHFSQPISMTDMADLAGLSKTHFNRRFRELLRLNPTEYLRSIRVHAAQSQLANTSRSLSEIAVAVGFTDQSHFTRRFRQVTGMTPAQWRKRFVK